MVQGARRRIALSKCLLSAFSVQYVAYPFIPLSGTHTHMIRMACCWRHHCIGDEFVSCLLSLSRHSISRSSVPVAFLLVLSRTPCELLRPTRRLPCFVYHAHTHTHSLSLSLYPYASACWEKRTTHVHCGLSRVSQAGGGPSPSRGWEFPPTSPNPQTAHSCGHPPQGLSDLLVDTGVLLLGACTAATTSGPSA